MSFCKEIREQANVYFEASFHHPFVKELVNGTLPIEKFAYYMLQDAYYLKHYSKVLALTAAKAKSDKEMDCFLEKAQFVQRSELALHTTVFKELSITEEQVQNFEPAPAAYNYVSHMYQAIQHGDVDESFAAMFPCPWLYQEIGEYYRDKKPGVKVYEDWLAMYSDASFKQSIEEQKAMMDRYAMENPQKLNILKSHFIRSCYYEWQFWEMPWMMQTWESEVMKYELI
ncbi:MAG: thiaminase II [Lysinibacillus sp.]